MSETNDTANSTCPKCGINFHCGYEAKDKTCWCFQLPHIAADDTISGCLCPNCLRERIREQKKQQNQSQPLKD